MRSICIAPLVLCGFVAGCQQQASSDWVKPGTPQNPATPPVKGGPAAHAINVQALIVRQETSQAGVAADVFKLDDSNGQVFFATVDDTGRASPGKDCAVGERFVVTPKTPAYLQMSPRPCAATIEFELSSAQAMMAVVVRADTLMTTGDFAKAQVYYSLAASRLQYSQPAEALTLQNKAHIAAGRALQIAKPTVQINNEEKFTEETKNKLRAFQSKNGLSQTGILDSPTQTALSGISPAEALKSVHPK
jgi:hypothetical protein